MGISAACYVAVDLSPVHKEVDSLVGNQGHGSDSPRN